MQVLPVLDLRNGVVVRAVAGRRVEYRPVVSHLVESAEPVAVAEAIRAHFGLSELYVADLDAIAGREPALHTFRALGRLGFRLWVDAGVRDRERAGVLAAEGVGVVVGLETVAGPAVLADLFRTHADRAVFSLDLRNGIPLGDRAAWEGADAWEIAGRAVGSGATRLLVLDLARVGIGSGPGTEALCCRLISTFPHCDVWVGGSVRNADDLRHVRAIGVTAVLVASALHGGSLTPSDLRALGDGRRAALSSDEVCS
jgi:phosphoribosylformimino-5-aminoimidazole carboxamide ribotide isomerase